MAPPQSYGRDRELAVLSDLIQRLQQGGRGALLVRGEPGLGKTALLTAVAHRAREHGARQ